MYELNPEYLEQLEGLAGEIQESQELQQYLEEEEDEYYDQLKANFEPRIALVYDEVASTRPLQLVSMEIVLLDPAFEGLFLPKILGYSVLRGEVDEHFRYVRPQDHFKEILLTICHSTNFEQLKKRIGQSIQIGFALSSDIWVTNLIQEIENKRVRHFLQAQKQERYRHEAERAEALMRYKRQFHNENFRSAEFPETMPELQILFNSLKEFLLYRIEKQYDNSSLLPFMDQLIANEALQGSTEHLVLITIYGAFFSVPDESQAELADVFNRLRTEMQEFDQKVLGLLHDLHTRRGFDYAPEADTRLGEIVDRDVEDELTRYFNLMDLIHREGYNSQATQEAIKEEYDRHEGLSLFNENVRRTIYGYFNRFISNLDERDYPELFEISKLYSVYMNLFGNQHFNLDLKELSMRYVQRLLRLYTDKRGKDYQDIKKFVSTTFQDLNFLTEKEIIELFKTRRKRKKAEQ